MAQPRNVRLVTETALDDALADPDFQDQIKGPVGPAPALAAGTTTQVASGQPAEFSLVQTGEDSYRVDARIPKGVDGDPAGITDLGNAMASAINTDGSAPNSALKAQSVQAGASSLDALDGDLRARVVALAGSIASSASAAVEARAGGLTSVQDSKLHNTDQVGVLASNDVTMTADTEHASVNGAGIKVTTSGATANAWVLRNFTPAISGEDFSGVGLILWVENASLITSLQVEFNTNVGVWTRLASASRTDDVPAPNGLVNGLNVLRWNWVSGGQPNWSQITRVRVLANVNTATSFTIQSVFTEEAARKKAQIVFINDGAFRNYETYFAARMREMGFPTQWAIGCSTVQLATTASPNLTVQELQELQARGDSVSFHNHDTFGLLGGGQEIASQATGPQLLLWTQKAQAWLKARGFRGWYFRSAWLQNNAPAAPTSGVWDILAACPTHTGRTALQSWPLQSPNAYPRITYHGMAQTALDNHFANLKATRQLGVFYTHDVNNSGGSDMTEAEADYFLEKCRVGVEEGWLEGVTFETLFARDGARYVDDGTGNPSFTFSRDGQARVLGD